MQRLLLSLPVSLAALAVGICVSPAAAMVIAPQPGPTRVVNSDAVIVGKVVALEPQDVKVMNVTYRIAVVEVAEAIRGAKDGKTLRIGFVPPPPGAKGPILIKNRALQLQVGMDGLFLLRQHPKENFYTVGGIAGFYIPKDNAANFDKEVKTVKTIVRVIDNPQPLLKSKDADERLLAAAVLIDKYRTFRPVAGQPAGPSKQEPIDAAESKLIMLALADADWTAQVALGSLRPNPSQLFYRLGIDKNAGWVQPSDAKPQPAMQAWLRDNAEKFRIQRFVAGDTK